MDWELYRTFYKGPVRVMTNESGPDPADHPHCERVCPEHRYTTTEIAQLAWSIYDEVRPLRQMLDEPKRRIDELPLLLAHIGRCIESGSPILEPPPQGRLYLDHTTGVGVGTIEPP